MQSEERHENRLARVHNNHDNYNFPRFLLAGLILPVWVLYMWHSTCKQVGVKLLLKTIGADLRGTVVQPD